MFWLFVMLLPGILSIESPHFLRTLAAAPVAYILSAIGIIEVGRLLRYLSGRGSNVVQWAYVLAIAILLLVVATTTYRDYFENWPKNPNVYAVFEGDVTTSAKYLATVQGEPIVMASAVYVPHPTTMYISRPFADMRFYDSDRALVIPAAKSGSQGSAQGAVFVVMGANGSRLPMLRAAFADGGVTATGVRPDGATSFSAFSVPDLGKMTPIEPPRSLTVTIGDVAQIIGYDLRGSGVGNNGSPTAKQDETLELTLYWKPLRRVDKPDLRFFAHFTDSKPVLFSQDDGTGYLSTQWRGGELVIDQFHLKVPANATPGKYTVRLGMYALSTLIRLELFDSAGRSMGNDISLPPVKIALSRNDPPSPSRSSSGVLAGSAQLLGYDLSKAADGAPVASDNAISAGEKLRVTLFWKDLAPMKEDYTVFLQLIRPSGEMVVQSEGQPLGGRFPTSLWDPGDYITDPHELAIPADLAPGEYRLIAGMYLLGSGERLRSEAGNSAILLGTINVFP